MRDSSSQLNLFVSENNKETTDQEEEKDSIEVDLTEEPDAEVVSDIHRDPLRETKKN